MPHKDDEPDVNAPAADGGGHELLDPQPARADAEAGPVVPVVPDMKFWDSIASDFMLPCALRVAGACHLLHSVSQETFEGMLGWDRYWAALIVFDRLLMVKFRRDRIVGRCCDNNIDKDMFRNMKQVRLYKKKWSVVFVFLNALMPVLSTLRRVWDISKYGSVSSKEDEELGDGCETPGGFSCHSSSATRRKFKGELLGIVRVWSVSCHSRSPNCSSTSDEKC